MQLTSQVYFLMDQGLRKAGYEVTAIKRVCEDMVIYDKYIYTRPDGNERFINYPV